MGMLRFKCSDWYRKDTCGTPEHTMQPTLRNCTISLEQSVIF